MGCFSFDLLIKILGLASIGIIGLLLVGGMRASACQRQWKGIYSDLCSSPFLWPLPPVWKPAYWFCVHRRTKLCVPLRDQNENTSTKRLASGYQTDPYFSLWLQEGKHQRSPYYNKYVELQTGSHAFTPFGFSFSRGLKRHTGHLQIIFISH